MNLEKIKTGLGYNFNRITTMSLISLLKKSYMEKNNVHIEYYKPKHKTFIFICNHTDAADPGYEMAAMGRYLRFVASDHVLRMKYVGWVFKNIGGVIIKYREKPSSILTDEIIKNLKAGIPVGLHAEGAMTINGQSGYVSDNTGKLVKDSGVALVTYHFVGGYLRKPRWADSPRKGPIIGHFVNEYSPEELAKLSDKEIADIIRRDIYVNAYDEQRKNPQDYSGENLAECVERVLYVCPKCHEVGKLHSKGDYLKCDCGYSVKMESDGFFHDDGHGVIYDNVLDWDLWQRNIWKDKLLAVSDNEVIIKEAGQIVKRVDKEFEEVLTEDGELYLYKDRLEIKISDTNVITMKMNEIKQLSLSGKDKVLVVDHNIFLDINSKTPRSPTKYIAAWRYLTGKEYY